MTCIFDVLEMAHLYINVCTLILSFDVYKHTTYKAGTEFCLQKKWFSLSFLMYTPKPVHVHDVQEIVHQGTCAGAYTCRYL